MSDLDNFFLKQEEPSKSCLLFLRAYILSRSEDVTEHWKYGLPFYYHKDKMWCYLWMHKKHKMPYVGFVDGDKLNHKDLLQEKRARMKILLINPSNDIPLKKLNSIFKEAMQAVKQERVWLRSPNMRSR